MKHLKLVETASKAVQNDYLTIYNVKDDGSVVIKGGEAPNDPYQYYVTYNVTSTTAPTQLYQTYGAQAYITAMSIDGGEDVTPSATTTFNTTGEHVVAYKVNEEYSDVIAPIFAMGLSAITKVKIGKGLKHIWYYGFQSNSNLSAVTVGNVDYTSTKELYQALAKNGTGAQIAFSGTKLIQNYEAPSITSGDYIDLGLSVKWASCNLGASSPTEYGKYYQWGDTVGYTDASHSTWATAPFNNGSSSYNSTYFASVSGTVCPNGVLAKEYDAVYQATNGQAHMPTKEQYSELLFGSVGEYTTVNGVNGVMLTSIKDNSKSIFIPSAGYAYDGSFSLRGSGGYVWSSSLNSSYPLSAWLLYFYSGNLLIGNDYRYYGFSVRGVLE